MVKEKKEGNQRHKEKPSAYRWKDMGSKRWRLCMTSNGSNGWYSRATLASVVRTRYEVVEHRFPVGDAKGMSKLE